MAMLAKLSRPKTDGVCPRERLFARIDDCRRRKAVWISGPPGAGKTTLAASWLDARGMAAIWYQADAGDADPASFFYHLRLGATQAGADESALPLLTPEYLPDLPGFSRRYFRALYDALPRPLALVLDNYQDVPEGAPFHALVCGAITEAPDDVFVIVASRAEAPPEYARLRLGRHLASLGWEALRLTADEGVRIAANAGWNTDGIAAVVERCDGWAGGLILLLAHARAAGAAAAAETPASREALFDYFGTELFNASPPETRHLLLRTALLPWVSPTMAIALSGQEDAGARLDALCRRHLFTERHDAPAPAYRYHALFREFLAARIEQTYTPSERLGLAHKSAALLEQAGEVDAAISLYHSGGDEGAAVQLILAHAPAMAAQGRLQTLAGWIGALSADSAESTPWLMYWQGLCQMMADAAAARSRLETAFHRFRNAGDTFAQALTAAALVESYLLEMRDLSPLDTWLEVLQQLLAASPTIPDASLALRVQSCLLLGLLYRKPDSVQIAPCAECVYQLMATEAEGNVRLAAANRLLQYFGWIGDGKAAERILVQFRPQFGDPQLTPLNKWDWLIQEAWYYQFCRYEPDKVNEALECALDISECNGLSFLVTVCQLRVAMVCLENGDASGADRELAKVAAAIDAGVRADMAWFHWLKSWLALLQGETSTAIEYATRSTQWAAATGSAPRHAVGKLNEAFALADAGDIRAALACMRAARTLVKLKSPLFVFVSGLGEADLLLKLDEATKAEGVLRHTLALGREHGLFNTWQWLPKPIARVCAYALEHGIEPDYVRELIRKRGLKPPSPAVADWPWPVRIHTLGRFAVEIDSIPMEYGHKPPKKPLALLKAIIALDGQGATEHQLIDALWPDEEADAAHEALNVALYRLRKLLGHAEAVQLHDGRLALDAGTCWVDALAFERLVREADQAAIRDPVDLMQRALALYAGHFLADADEAWAISLRERLRSQFSRLVCACGAALRLAGRWDEALACYRRGLETDELAEEFCQGVMRCCHRLERPSEGVSAYHRLRQALSAVLGVLPSPETESLLVQLLDLLH